MATPQKQFFVYWLSSWLKRLTNISRQKQIPLSFVSSLTTSDLFPPLLSASLVNPVLVSVSALALTSKYFFFPPCLIPLPHAKNSYALLHFAWAEHKTGSQDRFLFCGLILFYKNMSFK